MRHFIIHIDFKLLQQVSTSAVAEEKEVPVANSIENSKLSSLESSSHRIITVHYVLEESSGYMEPTLRILAILHTVISFFCIIGYYCLKVRGQGIQSSFHFLEAVTNAVLYLL